MLILLLLFILYCIAEGYEHGRYTFINHWPATLRRMAVGLVAVYGYCGANNHFWLYVNTILVFGFTFLVFFNIVRNIVAHQPWNYIGKTAEWDKFMSQFPNRTVWIAYFTGFVLSVTVQLFNSTFVVHAEPLINLSCHF